MKACITFRLTLLLASLLAASAPGMAQDGPSAIQIGYAARELLSNTQSKEDRVATARQLRERFESLPLPKVGNPDWDLAALAVAHASIHLEWPTAVAARSALESWWKKCEALPPSKQRWMLLRTADSFLMRWASTEPDTVLDLVEEVDRRTNQNAPESGHTDAHWQFRKASVAQRILEESERRRLDTEAARRRQATAILERYWRDPTIDLQTRTKFVSSRARELHSQNRFAEAARLMDAWTREHPRAPYEIRFCFTRFCVAFYGEGDAETARKMLSIMDELLATGVVSPDTWEVKAMTVAYYQHLLRGSISYLQQLNDFAEETRKMSEPPASQ